MNIRTENIPLRLYSTRYSVNTAISSFSALAIIFSRMEAFIMSAVGSFWSAGYTMQQLFSQYAQREIVTGA